MGNSVQTRLKHVEPPRAVDVELRVLSSLCNLAEPTQLRVQKAMLTLDAECFYNQDNRQLFQIIQALFNQDKEFSLVTLLGIIPDPIYDVVQQMISESYCMMSMFESDIQTNIDIDQCSKQ